MEGASLQSATPLPNPESDLNPPEEPTENLYLRGYAAWRNHSLTLRSRLLLLVMLPMLMLLGGLLWYAMLSAPAEQARQVDAVGQQLARQLAGTLAEPLKAGDHLSLNLQLAQWQQNPLIIHASVSNPEQRIIAEAGQRPSEEQLPPGKGRFSADINTNDTRLGQLQLSLAAEPWRSTTELLFSGLFQLWLIVLAAALLLAWRLAESQKSLLEALGLWDPEQSKAPGLQRHDEFGVLARRLNQRFGPPEPEPEPQPEPEPVLHTDSQENDELNADDIPVDGLQAIDPPDAKTVAPDQPGPQTTGSEPFDTAQDVSQEAGTPEAAIESATDTAMLCVRIGNQEALRRLSRERLLGLLERYRHHLERACQLYRGEQHTLHDGTAVLLFHAATCNQDELTHALCCGELLRVLAHDLQIEIADTGITLNLQLVLGHGSSPMNQPGLPLEQDETLTAALAQLEHSRNLLLLDAELAASSLLTQRAATRRLASQPEVRCVERLREPWQSALERQINQLYRERRG